MSVYTSGFEPRNFLILVVDDCRRNLAFLQEILEEANYQTIIATSGEQALNRLKGVTPSLIILDLMLPKMEGY